MMNEMETLERRMTTKIDDNDDNNNNSNSNNNNNNILLMTEEMNHMWSSFLSFKQAMEKPPNAPYVYKVQDNNLGFIALRDLLDAFPSDLAQSIFEEQLNNPH